MSAFVLMSAYASGVGAQQAMIPRLVGEGKIAAANNLASLSNSFAAVAGPAVGGILIGSVGVTAAYALDTATFTAMIGAVWLLPPMRPEGKPDRPSLRSLVDGFRYIRHSR